MKNLFVRMFSDLSKCFVQSILHNPAKVFGKKKKKKKRTGSIENEARYHVGLERNNQESRGKPNASSTSVQQLARSFITLCAKFLFAYTEYTLHLVNFISLQLRSPGQNLQEFSFSPRFLISMQRESRFMPLDSQKSKNRFTGGSIQACYTRIYFKISLVLNDSNANPPRALQ